MNDEMDKRLEWLRLSYEGAEPYYLEGLTEQQKQAKREWLKKLGRQT